MVDQVQEMEAMAVEETVAVAAEAAVVMATAAVSMEAVAVMAPEAEGIEAVATGAVVRDGAVVLEATGGAMTVALELCWATALAASQM